MPQFVDLDESDIEAIVDEGGVSSKTKQKRERIVGYFKEFVASLENPTNLDELMAQADNGKVENLETLLIDFFARFRVKVEGGIDLPKRATVDCYKSHMKTFILNTTDGKVDIANASVFKKLDKFFGGLFKTLKEAGRGDVTHTAEIPAETTKALHQLFGTLLLVLEARDTDGYDNEVAKLPENFRTSYHVLLQMAVMYTIIMFDVRRGQEGLAALKRDTYQKEFNQDLRLHYWQKKRGELTKNHRSDTVCC